MWKLLAVFLLLAMVPWLGSAYLLGTLTVACYFAVFAMSWDLLFGFANEVNFGPTFLIGAGAYTAGMLNWAGISIAGSLFGGVAAAEVCGLALAVPALRLTGPYFGLVTLASVLLLQQAVIIFAPFTGGEIGLTVRDVFSADPETNYWISLGVCVLTGVVLLLLSRSSVGLILQASSQDRLAAAALGFNVAKHKIAAFSISALFSGLAGAMLVFYMGAASIGTVIDISIGVQIIISAVLGGRRTIFGAALGTLALILAGEALRPVGEIRTFLVSGAALVAILFFPDGLVGQASRLWRTR